MADPIDSFFDKYSRWSSNNTQGFPKPDEVLFDIDKLRTSLRKVMSDHYQAGYFEGVNAGYPEGYNDAKTEAIDARRMAAIREQQRDQDKPTTSRKNKDRTFLQRIFGKNERES